MDNLYPRALRNAIEALLRTYDEISYQWPLAMPDGTQQLAVHLTDGQRFTITISPFRGYAEAAASKEPK